MKIREAMVCLDCDELYSQELDECPKCLNKFSVELRHYFKPLEMTTKDSVEKIRKERKWRDQELQ